VKKIWDIVEFILVLLVFSCIGLAFLACEDNYLTIERRVVDAENKVPVYFYAEAEQAEVDTWRPVFIYYVYYLEEGRYDAYFHAYCMQGDSVIWSGIQPLQIEGGKKVWGEYVSDASFAPQYIANVTPMAYVSVER